MTAFDGCQSRLRPNGVEPWEPIPVICSKKSKSLLRLLFFYPMLSKTIATVPNIIAFVRGASRRQCNLLLESPLARLLLLWQARELWQDKSLFASILNTKSYYRLVLYHRKNDSSMKIFRFRRLSILPCREARWKALCDALHPELCVWEFRVYSCHLSCG